MIEAFTLINAARKSCHIYDGAGRLSISTPGFAIHFVVYKKHRVWGFETEDYDRCLEYFGLGPLLLLCWIP